MSKKKKKARRREAKLQARQAEKVEEERPS
jgi:hypothetical protein